LKPLLYLEIRQFVNSLKNTLRSPKRLIPALIMAACFFSWALNMALVTAGLGRPSAHGLGATIGTSEYAEMIRAGAFLLLCFGSLAIIYQAFASGSLVFAIAHIDFLFPTPIPRRSVLLVKLGKDYLKYAFWVTFFVAFLGLPTVAAMNLSLFPYGLLSIAALTAYLLFIVNISHTINIVFTFGFERLRQARRLVKFVLALVVISAMALGVYQYGSSGQLSLGLRGAAGSPIIQTIFAPAAWCADVVVAPLMPPRDTDIAHLGLLWLLAGASFVLLMSRRENIYEPSLGVSVRAIRVRQAMRSGDAVALRVQMMREKGRTSAGLLVIPPFGRGAVALLWKGLLMRCRMSWNQIVAMLVLPPLVSYLMQRCIPLDEVLRFLPVILIYMSFILSITVQPQVRAELKHANILKAMPVSPWKVMLVQAINGSVYLAAGILVFAASLWLFVPAARGELLEACAVGSPFLGFACISATIIPALMYPDMRDSAQNFFSNLIGFMLISVAIVPTIVIGVVLIGLLKVSYYVALFPLCAVNALIGAAGVAVSGAIFRRFDPTSE